MQKDKQTAMVVEGKTLKLEPVHSETEIVTNKRFATIQMSIKVRDTKLEEIRNKIKKEKNIEKKNLMADQFIQQKMRLNKDKILAEGDFDDNWQSLKNKLFGDL